MVDLATVPTEELAGDLQACHDDIAVCEACLKAGVTHHKDGFPVQERIDTNRKIADLITAELERRSENPVEITAMEGVSQR